MNAHLAREELQKASLLSGTPPPICRPGLTNDSTAVEPSLVRLPSHNHLRNPFRLNIYSLASLYFFVLSLVLVLAILILHSVRRHCDKEEPPELVTWLPFLGHAHGFWKHGIDYFMRLADDCPQSPIFKVQLLNQTVYIVNKPEGSRAIEKNTKALSFSPLEVAVSERILKIDKRDMARIRTSVNLGKYRTGYMREIHNTHHKSLNSGLYLNQMRDKGFEEINVMLEGLQDQSVNLYQWTRSILTRSSVRAVWGPKNPFEDDPHLEEVFWRVDDHLKPLLINFFPKYLSRPGYLAREQMFERFLQYYDCDGHTDDSTSELVRAKHALNRQHGFSHKYMAQTDLGELTAVLFNLVPASFWLLIYICSSTGLLRDIRAEISQLFSTKDVLESGPAYRYDPTQLFRCHLFVATYHEVLRIVGSGVTTNRVALEDTVVTIEGREYKLRKGGIVQIPANVIHNDPSVWGEDVLAFNPQRFLDKPHLASSSAFRTFGGGASKCPGRHFAQTQVLAFVARVIMDYEIQPDGDESATWELPEKDTARLPGVLKPKEDVRVRITSRFR